MNLVIKNTDKVVGLMLCGGMYKMTGVRESDTHYEFEVTEILPSFSKTLFRLDRFGEWDAGDKKWYYRFEHRASFVSADYFSDMKNVKKTFDGFLKD